MMEYGPEEFTELAFRTLEEFLKTNPRHIVISHVGKSWNHAHIGMLSLMQVCEREVRNEKDFDRWMERIQISPLEYSIPCFTEDGELRDVSEIIEELKKMNKYKIGICVKILKKINDQEILARLLGNFFLIKSKYFIPEKEGRHYWFVVRDDRDFELTERFYRLSKEEALGYML